SHGGSVGASACTLYWVDSSRAALNYRNAPSRQAFDRFTFFLGLFILTHRCHSCSALSWEKGDRSQSRSPVAHRFAIVPIHSSALAARNASQDTVRPIRDESASSGILDCKIFACASADKKSLKPTRARDWTRS